MSASCTLCRATALGLLVSVRIVINCLNPEQMTDWCRFWCCKSIYIGYSLTSIQRPLRKSCTSIPKRAMYACRNEDEYSTKGEVIKQRIFHVYIWFHLELLTNLSTLTNKYEGDFHEWMFHNIIIGRSLVKTNHDWCHWLSFPCLFAWIS